MEIEKTLGHRIRAVRLAEQMSQSAFSEALKISATYLSQLETNAKVPSPTLLELISCRFRIRGEWLREGQGGPVHQEVKEKPIPKPLSTADTFKRDALVTACVLGPVAPIISGGIAIGVGTAHILSKMCTAYDVNNAAKLAAKLGVDKSTIKLWLKKDRVPEKYLHKSLSQTELKPKDLKVGNNLAIIDISILRESMNDLLTKKLNASLSDQEFESLLEVAKK